MSSPPRLGVSIVAPIAFLVRLTIGLTVIAGPMSRVTAQAAEQLLDRDAYVRAVLGEGGCVLLGNMLLALAWAALQGDFSLQALLTGQILGYLEWLSDGLFIAGGTFGLLAGVGVLRMSDVFTRMQASTKASTHGLGCLLAAVALRNPERLLWCEPPVSRHSCC